MPRFPYTNFPFPFYRNYSRSPSPTYNFSTSHMNLNNDHRPRSSISNNSYIEKGCMDSSKNVNSFTDFSEIQNSINLKTKNKSNKNNEDYLFDLFGLKIYSDDVLLVSLIYFLYSEGVKDDGLFIVLILLLIS